MKLGGMGLKIGIYALLGLLLVAAAGTSIYFYSRSENLESQLGDSSLAVKKEAEDLLGKVGKLMELPADEYPTIATVSDPEKLQSQAFFAKAQTGDRVIVYAQARKIILYRPSSNKIVDVGSVNMENTTPEGVVAGTNTTNSAPPEQKAVQETLPEPKKSPEKLKVAIYNGSQTVGLGKTKADELKSKFDFVDVVLVSNANKGDYTSTYVVDVKETENASATQIAEALSGQLSGLPEGEESPADADIIIILGE